MVPEKVVSIFPELTWQVLELILGANVVKLLVVAFACLAFFKALLTTLENPFLQSIFKTIQKSQQRSVRRRAAILKKFPRRQRVARRIYVVLAYPIAAYFASLGLVFSLLFFPRADSLPPSTLCFGILYITSAFWLTKEYLESADENLVKLRSGRP